MFTRYLVPVVRNLSYTANRASISCMETLNSRVIVFAQMAAITTWVLVPNVAQAYFGESAILWFRSTILAPLGLFAIVIFVVGCWFKSTLTAGLGTFLVLLLLGMWITGNGDVVKSKLEQVSNDR